MKFGLVWLVFGCVVLALGAPAAADRPIAVAGLQNGPWTGEWKVVRIESDSGRRLASGRLSLVQRGAVVCGSWSWNRFADGSLGASKGTASGLTMRARGRDARALVNWTIKLRAEVVDRFIGSFTEVEPESEAAAVGTMYGTRIGPPRRRPAC